MITIRGFAKLCGCNTQTLRFYDRIGLLIPAKVDEWTGYRYYEEDQAMRFVKIKNLQQADFSIEEIRPLLEENEDRLAEAFERKIEEQQQKLYLQRSVRDKQHLVTVSFSTGFPCSRTRRRSRTHLPHPMLGMVKVLSG